MKPPNEDWSFLVGYMQQAGWTPEAVLDLLRSKKRRVTSARQAITERLARSGVPLSVSQLAEELQINPSSFSALRRDERKRFARKRGKGVFIVPALKADFSEMTRYLALSTWSADRRVVPSE